MATTMADIRIWFKAGVEKGHTHMAVFCDSFSYEDYPVYFDGAPEEVRQQVLAKCRNMQKLMEVYHLGSDMEEQLRMHRCHQYEPLENVLEELGEAADK